MRRRESEGARDTVIDYLPGLALIALCGLVIGSAIALTASLGPGAGALPPALFWLLLLAWRLLRRGHTP